MATFDETIVHVRDEFAGACRVGLVIARFSPPDGGSYPELRLRVIKPSAYLASMPGTDDDEGVYRHATDARRVGLSPAFRMLDSWHRITSCVYGDASDAARARLHDAPEGAGESVEASRG